MAKTHEGKQVENGSETVEDAASGFESEPEQLCAAAAALRAILEEESSRQPLPQQILIALCILIEKSPEISDKGWESKDLVTVVAEHFGRKDWAAALKVHEKEVSDRTRRLVLPHWKTLLASWNNEQVGIEQRLQARGIELKPIKPYKEGEEGGRGKTARYFLRFAPADPDFRDRYPEPKGIVSEIPPIRYFTDEIKSISLLKWLSQSGLFLGGWGGRLLVGAMVIIFVVLVFIVWMFLTAAMTLAESAVTLFQYGMVAAIFVAIGYVSLGWAFRLVEDRCALAPWLLQLFSGHDDYLLELRRGEGATINSIFLVRYTGSCPICHGTVHIESGRREFSGRRLVGRCRKAPNAHVFSFDHETRWGRFLR